MPDAAPSTLVVIPVPAADATVEADGTPTSTAVADARTTAVVDGTPTVSLFFTVTVTEKQRETVTLLVPS